MNKIFLITVATIITHTTVHTLNITCVHETIQNALKESTCLETYKQAWHDISTLYLESEQDLTPLIEYTLDAAQKQHAVLEQQLTCSCAPISAEKLTLACGIGKLVAGAYLALGIIAFPLDSYNYLDTEKLMTFCFPIPKAAESVLYWLITHYRGTSTPMTNVQKTGFYLRCAQWFISLPLAPYLFYKGVQKIDKGLHYTQRLEQKITTLNHIIAYMQELRDHHTIQNG